MKESIKFNNGARECEFLFNIRSLKEMEQELGFSLNLLFTPNVALGLRLMTIHFTQLGVKYGLQDKQPEDKDPYEFIERYCDSGGTLDTLNAYILAAIDATNLFTEGPAAKREELIAMGLEATPMISPNPQVRFFFVKDPAGVNVLPGHAGSREPTAA